MEEARINDSTDPKREWIASSKPKYRVTPAGIKPERARKNKPMTSNFEFVPIYIRILYMMIYYRHDK